MSEDEIKETLEDIEDLSYLWMKMKKHWLFVIIVIAACSTAFVFGFVLIKKLVDNILVLEWSINSIGDFSPGTLFYAMLWIILWEIVLIALPTLGFLGLWLCIYWFALVSEEERTELKDKMKERERKERERKKWHKRHGEQAGGASGLTTIIMMIIIAHNGNWLEPLSTLPISYFVNVWLTIIFWTLIILGIPALIVGLAFLFYKKK